MSFLVGCDVSLLPADLWKIIFDSSYWRQLGNLLPLREINSSWCSMVRQLEVDILAPLSKLRKIFSNFTRINAIDFSGVEEVPRSYFLLLRQISSLKEVHLNPKTAWTCLQELSDVPCARRSLERLHISVSSSDRDKGIYTLQKSEHLTAFRSLKVFTLSNVQLSELNLIQICSIASLTELHFCANSSWKPMGALTSLERLCSLRVLRFDDPFCRIEQEEAEALARLSSLKTLRLTTRLSPQKLQALSKCASLRNLRFEFDGDVNDAYLSILSTLTQLHRFYFDRTSIPFAQWISQMCRLPNLRAVAQHFIVGSNDVILLTRLAHLSEIRFFVSRSELIHSMIPCWKKLKQLELRDITGVLSLQMCTSLTNLRQLRVSTCESLEDGSLDGLEFCTRMKLLSFESLKNLTRLESLSELRQLESLSISDCSKVSDSALWPLSRLEYLSVLKLTCPSITGSAFQFVAVPRLVTSLRFSIAAAMNPIGEQNLLRFKNVRSLCSVLLPVKFLRKALTEIPYRFVLLRQPISPILPELLKCSSITSLSIPSEDVDLLSLAKALPKLKTLSIPFPIRIERYVLEQLAKMEVRIRTTLTFESEERAMMMSCASAEIN